MVDRRNDQFKKFDQTMVKVFKNLDEELNNFESKSEIDVQNLLQCKRYQSVFAFEQTEEIQKSQ
jgi:hypothetical protein